MLDQSKQPSDTSLFFSSFKLYYYGHLKRHKLKMVNRTRNVVNTNEQNLSDIYFESFYYGRILHDSTSKDITKKDTRETI